MKWIVYMWTHLKCSFEPGPICHQVTVCGKSKEAKQRYWDADLHSQKHNWTMNKHWSGMQHCTWSFIDYEKAFNKIHHETLWKIMRHYGFQEKYIRLVKMFYSNSKCSVVTEAGNGTWFEVKSGVKQGCVMSGFLLILVRPPQSRGLGSSGH